MPQKGKSKLQLKESIKPPKVEQLVEVRVSEKNTSSLFSYKNGKCYQTFEEKLPKVYKIHYIYIDR